MRVQAPELHALLQGTSLLLGLEIAPDVFLQPTLADTLPPPTPPMALLHVPHVSTASLEAGGSRVLPRLGDGSFGWRRRAVLLLDPALLQCFALLQQQRRRQLRQQQREQQAALALLQQQEAARKQEQEAALRQQLALQQQRREQQAALMLQEQEAALAQQVALRQQREAQEQEGHEEEGGEEALPDEASSSGGGSHLEGTQEEEDQLQGERSEPQEEADGEAGAAEAREAGGEGYLRHSGSRSSSGSGRVHERPVVDREASEGAGSGEGAEDRTSDAGASSELAGQAAGEEGRDEGRDTALQEGAQPESSEAAGAADDDEEEEEEDVPAPLYSYVEVQALMAMALAPMCLPGGGGWRLDTQQSGGVRGSVEVRAGPVHAAQPHRCTAAGSGARGSVLRHAHSHTLARTLAHRWATRAWGPGAHWRLRTPSPPRCWQTWHPGRCTRTYLCRCARACTPQPARWPVEHALALQAAPLPPAHPPALAPLPPAHPPSPCPARSCVQSGLRYTGACHALPWAA